MPDNDRCHEVLGWRSRGYRRAQVGTIPLKLLKIGTVITCNTRGIRQLFASGYP